MPLTVTSLTHPTMIAKIRAALYYAHKGQGHMMDGHGQRCYIRNAKGHAIMRLNWLGGGQGYIVWGQGSKDITSTVKAALSVASVRSEVSKVDRNRMALGLKPKAGYAKVAASVIAGLALTGCQIHGATTVMLSFLGGVLT